MRLCPALHPPAPAVRQFTSAYYPEPALRLSVHYTIPDQSFNCCLIPSFDDTPQMTPSLSPRTGNVLHFRTYQPRCRHVWRVPLRWKGNLLCACACRIQYVCEVREPRSWSCAHSCSVKCFSLIFDIATSTCTCARTYTPTCMNTLI